MASEYLNVFSVSLSPTLICRFVQNNRVAGQSGRWRYEEATPERAPCLQGTPTAITAGHPLPPHDCQEHVFLSVLC